MTEEPGDLLTLHEAAAAVGCHYQTIYRRVRSGDVPAFVAGGTYRIRRDDLEAWLSSREATAGAVPGRGVRDWGQQADGMLEILLQGDVEAARRQVDRLLAGGATVADLCDRLFAPALFRIGEMWRADHLPIADEHRASRMVEALLERASGARAKPGPRLGTVVVAAPQGDRHALAAQMVAAGLKADGFVVHYLGADLPPAEIVELAEREQADLVALSWCVEAREGLGETLRSLQEAGVPTIVGGSGIGGAEALELGATGYGGSIAEAQRIARQLVRASVAR